MKMKFLLGLTVAFFAVNAAFALPSDKIVTNGVIEEFKNFSKNPHCTFHESDATKYMAEKFKKIGASVVVDEHGNVIADLPATKGLENVPTLIFQGHIDMVCAHSESFDPISMPIKIVVKDGVMTTDGNSSLGADDMINIAAVTWLFENEKFNHGKIRFIWTVSEEVGLVGARKLDAKYLQDAKYMINLDGFSLGRIVTGSAGGTRETYTKKVKLVKTSSDMNAFKIKVSGMKGGHSGYDINKQRANANKYLATFLYSQLEKHAVQLVSMQGGEAHNVIPRDSEAIVVVPNKYSDEFLKDVYNFDRTLKKAYALSENGANVSIEKTLVPQNAIDTNSGKMVLSFMTLVDNGVYETMQIYPHLPDTSSNMGLVKTENDLVTVTFMIRNSDVLYRDSVVANHKAAADLCDFDRIVTQYESWQPDKNNPLAVTVANAYKKVSGKDAVLSAEHIGIEPSAFVGKNPDLIIVSTGIGVHDAHSLTESCDVKDLPTFVKTMKETILQISKE